jgi:hypothetical protein
LLDGLTRISCLLWIFCFASTSIVQADWEASPRWAGAS